MCDKCVKKEVIYKYGEKPKDNETKKYEKMNPNNK